jgi:hypothetical protein
MREIVSFPLPLNKLLDASAPHTLPLNYPTTTSRETTKLTRSFYNLQVHLQTGQCVSDINSHFLLLSLTSHQGNQIGAAFWCVFLGCATFLPAVRDTKIFKTDDCAGKPSQASMVSTAPACKLHLQILLRPFQ